jgi:uncharacterized membrane protein
MKILYIYLATLIVLGILDFSWIGLIAKNFYKTQYGALLSSHPVLWAAVAFYLLYAAGLTYFVILPALAGGSILRAALIGLFFGLIAYGTYDLTNQSLIPGYPVILTVVDMAWGAIAGGLVSTVVYLLASFLRL